ncbi:MAG: hypothetical protein ACE5KO_03850 [Candidatus Bathyarchaeia archaeon]
MRKIESQFQRKRPHPSYHWNAGYILGLDDSSLHYTELVRNPSNLQYYDIHDIVKIESAIPLQELSFFRTEWKNQVNLRLARKRGMQIGSHLKRAVIAEHNSLRYSEHLGQFGANFEMQFSDIIEISVGNLLSISKHVLYVNVIEPILRFLFIHKGYVLLHSACLSIDGKAILISAGTDTGKTSTVLKCLQNLECSFLSDDMTIIDPSGYCLCFPKPLTISAHTVNSLNGGDGERLKGLKLQIQSKIHSKTGRRFMRLLGELNLPILTLNALGQMCVPPPKYPVWNLVNQVRTARKAKLTHMIFLERGSFSCEKISTEQAFAKALQNTEDAYGFPPYREVVKNLKINSKETIELKKREKYFIESVLKNVNCWVIRVPDHSWSDHLHTVMALDDSPEDTYSPYALAL